MRRLIARTLVIAGMVASLGAATAPQPNSSPIKKAVSKVPKAYQFGRASWYGKPFHGRATASGEPYDMFQFTAAHRELPLGTVVRVTNLRNDRWVIVRINDRGPVPPSRIIDLSYGAAKILGLHRPGVERVRLDIVPPATVAMAQTVAGAQ